MEHVSDLAVWKAAAREGSEQAPALLRKAYSADEVKADGDSRRITFTISTGAVDRDGDTLAVKGWVVDSYLKNPVVLWAHRYDMPPVAKAISVVKRAGALVATAEFPPAGIYDMADLCFEFLKGGFLRATSVGFKPMEGTPNDVGGYDFTKQELREFSIVPVPANPEALMDMAKSFAGGLAAGLDMTPLTKALRFAREALGQPEPTPEPVAFDAGPFVAAAQAACEKRGRTLSAANESRIRSAADAAGAVAAALDEVLAQLPDETDPKAATSGGAPVLKLTELPRKAVVNVDPEAVKAAVVAAVSESVKGAILRARGRLD